MCVFSIISFVGQVDSDMQVSNNDDELTLDVEHLLTCPDLFPRTLLLLPFTDLVAEGFPIPEQSYYHSTSKSTPNLVSFFD